MLERLAHILQLVLSTGAEETVESASDDVVLHSTLHPASLLTVWWPEGFDAQEIAFLHRASKFSVFGVLMQAGDVFRARAALHQDRHRLFCDINSLLAEFSSRQERHELIDKDGETFLEEIRVWLLALPFELFPELTRDAFELLGITQTQADERLEPYHGLLDSVGGCLPDALEWV
jgi:hypothetical protein